MNSWADDTEEEQAQIASAPPAWTTKAPTIPEQEQLWLMKKPPVEKQVEPRERTVERQVPPPNNPTRHNSSDHQGHGKASDKWKKFAAQADIPSAKPSQVVEEQRGGSWRGAPPKAVNAAKTSHGHTSKSSNGHASKVSQGKIASLKDSFGFIKVVSEVRVEDIYFRFDEASRSKIETAKLMVGDELEFVIIVGKNGRMSASQLKLLEPGSVRVDQVDKAGLFGIVLKETAKYQQQNPHYQPSQHQLDKAFQGRIAIVENPDALEDLVPGDENFLSFAFRGISPSTSKAFPRRGDLVSFDSAVELSSGRSHAIKISTLKTGKERSRDIIAKMISSGKCEAERGIVGSLMEQSNNSVYMGTIDCENRDTKVYFYKNDLPKELAAAAAAKKQPGVQDWRRTLQTDTNIQIGAEMEFTVLQDPMYRENFIAVDMKQIPRGSVVMEEIVAPSVKAKLISLRREKDQQATKTTGRKKPSGDRPLIGTLELLEEVEGLDSTLEFNGEEMMNPRAAPGDTVVFVPSKHKKTKRVCIREVRLAVPSEEVKREQTPLDSWSGIVKRETGVVSTLRDAFGFIECFDRDGQVFFPLKEVILTAKDQGMIQQGDLVSFQIAIEGHQHNKSKHGKSSDERRTVATRVLKIEEASSIHVVEEGIIGTITKALPHNRRSSEGGLVSFLPSLFPMNEMWEMLVRFSNNELMVKGTKNKATKVLIISDTHGGYKESKSAKENSSTTYSIKVPQSVQSLARFYCKILFLSTGSPPGELEILEISQSESDFESMNLRFEASSIAKQQKPFCVGDKVKLDFVLNKRKSGLEVHNMTLLESAPKVVAKEKRSDTESGVVASIQKDGFGFIQGCERAERVFFNHVDCEDEYKHQVQLGDEVEFKLETSKKGNKAVSIRPVVSVVVDTMLDEVVYRGTITKEAKRKSDIKGVKWTHDHPTAAKIAQAQLSPSLLGRLVPGTVIPEELFREGKESKNTMDWRKSNEVHKQVNAFQDGTEPEVWEVEPSPQTKEIERFAKKLPGLFTGHLTSGSLIVARSLKALNGYKTQHNKEDEVTAAEQPVDDKGSQPIVYYWSMGDCNDFEPEVGDEVEYRLCTNVATKQVRATSIRLVNSETCYRGLVEGQVSQRGGYIRPHAEFAGKGSAGLFGEGSNSNVDEAFKPGAGGRDGTVRFDRSREVLNSGDEVEYALLIHPTTKAARAIRVKLVKRAAPVEELHRTATPPQVNRELLKRFQASNAVPRFHTAKGPDGTPGFDIGRGRELTAATKLRVNAKEFKPIA